MDSDLFSELLIHRHEELKDRLRLSTLKVVGAHAAEILAL